MSSVNLSDYKKIYLETAKEYIDNLYRSCKELENNPTNKEALRELHISAHSLRSQSQVMNYTNISNLTGTIERIARGLLDGTYNIDNRFTSFLEKAITELNLSLTDIEKADKERDLKSLLKELEGLYKTL
ncbi:MAG: hypothetical protein AABY07_05505 [Nanoarchaeota archaeon]